MSNKTDLQTLNTDYAALIDTLRGKAVGGGGGSVETCTVTISTTLATNLNVQAIVATVCEDGVVSTIAQSMGTKGRAPGLTLPITIENVVCGSDFIIQASNIDGGSNTSIMGATLSGGVVQKDYIYFHSTNTVYTTVKCLFMLVAPTTAGATGTVSIKNQAGK